MDYLHRPGIDQEVEVDNLHDFFDGLERRLDSFAFDDPDPPSALDILRYVEEHERRFEEQLERAAIREGD